MVGDLVTLQRGTTYDGSLVGAPGPALLGLGSIAPGGGFREGHWKTFGGQCPKKLMLQPGDIYVALKGATKDGSMIGSVARVPPSVPSGRLTQDTAKLEFRSRDPQVQRYLYWILRTPDCRAYCAGRQRGTTAASLGREDFLGYPVPPMTATRLRTVELLEALDDKIDLNRRMSQTLESLARALFKSWFVDLGPVRAKSESRDTGLPKPIADLFPSSLVESELGEVPDGWEIQSLGESVDLVKGRSYTSEELTESDTALVTLKSFARGGGYRPDGLKSFTGSYKAAQVVTPGELVVACTDVTQAAEVIGRPAIVRGTGGYTTLVASLDTMIVRPRSARLTRGFLYFLGGTDAFATHTYAHTTGTTVLHLAAGAIPSFRFACPPAALVRRFESLASATLDRIQTLGEASNTIATIRDSLVPKLMTGQFADIASGVDLELG